jgi:stage V sporulation protein AF
MNDTVNSELLSSLKKTIDSLQVTSLTMGAKSLEELLIKKHWWTPLPSIQITERPDVAASYLMEGHILIVVDNSPTVLILPCTIFQFTQSPEDYYKSPLVGGYFRFVRFLCIPASLLLMPIFLLITVYYPQFALRWGILSTDNLTPLHLIVFVAAVEFLLDLFKYSASVSSSRFSGSLSIVGGLLIGDIAVSLNWASVEVLFYAAVTLLTSLSLASVEFADALRLYRIFLIILTAAFGKIGFIIGVALVSVSVICTPTFGGMSYFWPLFPFNGKALKALLFRQPTSKAQPSAVWNRGPVKP